MEKADVGRVREEKRREEKKRRKNKEYQRREEKRRERVRRKKMKAREKVENVAKRCLGAPEARKVGSLKQQVRSNLVR